LTDRRNLPHVIAMTLEHDLALTVDGVAATRGERVVVSGVSFVLPPGGGLVLRGGNGTGKTTLLRAIAGFGRLAEGTISFTRSNSIVDPDEVRAHQVHWLGGEDGLADRLTVRDTLCFWAGLSRSRPGDVLAQVGLHEPAEKPVGQLSTGQRRRLGLARLLMAPRSLWLLDEPMAGLDSDGRALVVATVADHRANGGVCVMASHEEGLENAATLRLSEAR
jgi:heme exporter protein A